MRDDLVVLTFYGGPRDGERLTVDPIIVGSTIADGYHVGLTPAGLLALIWEGVL